DAAQLRQRVDRHGEYPPGRVIHHVQGPRYGVGRWLGSGRLRPAPYPRLQLALREIRNGVRRHDAPAVAERINDPAGASIRLVLEWSLDAGAGDKRSRERRI